MEVFTSHTIECFNFILFELFFTTGNCLQRKDTTERDQPASSQKRYVYRQPNKIMAPLFTSDWFRFVTFTITYEWYKPKPVTWEK